MIIKTPKLIQYCDLTPLYQYLYFIIRNLVDVARLYLQPNTMITMNYCWPSSVDL